MLPQVEKRKLSIGFIMTSASRMAGGIFSATTACAKALTELGHEITVYALEDQFSRQDIEYWRPIVPKLYPGVWPTWLGYSPQLARSIRDHDILHQHGLWQGASWISTHWRRRAKHNSVISPHGMLDPWALNHSKFKKAVAGICFERNNLNSASFVHALNQAEVDAAHKYGVSAKVEIIPNGIELPDLRRFYARPPSFPPKKRVLLFLGRIHPKKGLVGLLIAWHKLVESKPELVSIWHLVIAGWDDGGHLTDLRSLVAQRGLAESVSLVGPLYGEDKSNAYASCDAFILPSLSEGLPMSVLEAWSFAKPVFMTEYCNLPDGLAAGAALAIGTEPELIAGELAACLSLSGLCEAGGRGRRLVEEHYQWKNIAKRFESAYIRTLAC